MLIEYFLFIEHLKEKLDDYIKLWNGLVKVFRNERREGLIQARSIGAQKAKLGQVGNTGNLQCQHLGFGNRMIIHVFKYSLDSFF